jgi:hypothetical protein
VLKVKNGVSEIIASDERFAGIKIFLNEGDYNPIIIVEK